MPGEELRVIQRCTLNLMLDLLAQRVKPDRTELWLHADDLAQLPRAVLRLERHGLTIRTIDRDLKSYKKLIPALIARPDAYICTADDDAYYPQRWLDSLVDNVVEGERCALGHRAHYIRVTANGQPQPYVRWEIDTRREVADPHVFLTGVGGVLYPPGCFNAEVLNEAAFRSLAPHADDLWFYFMLRGNGYLCRKVPGRLKLRMWSGSQEVSLVASNAFEGQNDHQMQKLLARYGNPLRY